MALTYIIGNGFDVNLKLKTRYADFYEVYINEETRNGNIARFKHSILKYMKNYYQEDVEVNKEILESYVNWADFEHQMGIYSQKFTADRAASEFAECLADFVMSFNKYLLKQCNSIDWNSVIGADGTRIREEFVASIVRPQDKLIDEELKDILDCAIKKIRTVNFLQFNYTNVFDKLLDMSGFLDQLVLNYIKYGRNEIRNHLAKFGVNLHVHGEMGLDNFITMGVDNPSQIDNPFLRGNAAVLKTFVKQSKLDVDERRSRDLRIERELAKKTIKDTDVFCAFGASIGDTDKFWWKLVGKRLQCNTESLFVIFDISGIQSVNPVLDFFNRVDSTREEEITHRFLRNAEMPIDWAEKNPNRIIVQLDTGMFGMNELPKRT